MQLVVATASGAPTRAAKARSNSSTRGPWVSQPEAMTAATDSASPPPNHGFTMQSAAVEGETLVVGMRWL